MRRIVPAVLAVTLSLSCHEDLTQESQQPEPQLSTTASCTTVATTDVFKFWNCNTNVYLNVQSLSVSDRGVIERAANTWNTVLHDAYPQLPLFTTNAAVLPRNYTINVVKNGNPGTWCGDVFPKEPNRPTSLTVGTTAAGSLCGDPDDVAIHELGHIAGFGGKFHDPVVNLKHCAVALTKTIPDNNVTTNGGPCLWEVETLLALYGVRPTAISRTKLIITTLFGPTGPTSLAVPNSASLGYTSYGFGGANGTHCGKRSQDVCAADEVVRTMNGLLDWSSSDMSVATVTTPFAQTTATARAAGSTTITARPRATSTYEVATGIKADRTLTVTAPPPPPPPPPDASILGNYTSPTNTIRSSQTCKFMAFPAGATYAWYRMNAGTALWKSIGSTREVSQGTSVTDFQLKVVVTNSSGSDTAILALDVSSSGVLCDGY